MRNLGAEIHIRIILTASFDAEAPKVFFSPASALLPLAEATSKALNINDMVGMEALQP